MTKAERFGGLKDLAGGRENGAARSLAESISDMQSKAADLKKLRSYLLTYSQDAEGGDSAVDTARLRNSRLFVARLSDAVTLQEGELAAATERYQQEAERWRSCHRQTTALQQLVDRYGLEELRDGERRDQKELDEQVARRRDE